MRSGPIGRPYVIIGINPFLVGCCWLVWVGAVRVDLNARDFLVPQRASQVADICAYVVI